MATNPLYPFPYRAFFLYLEPILTLAGAVSAFYTPQQYLQMTYPSPSPKVAALSTGTHIILRQLGNLYLAFALIESLILRATNDLKVWRTFLLILLIADFGHLLSVLPVGASIYYEIGKWGPMDWGNLGFVYLGAAMRASFLAGVGLGSGVKGQKRQRRSKPAQRITDGEAKAPKTPKTGTRKRSTKKTTE